MKSKSLYTFIIAAALGTVGIANAKKPDQYAPATLQCRALNGTISCEKLNHKYFAIKEPNHYYFSGKVIFGFMSANTSHKSKQQPVYVYRTWNPEMPVITLRIKTHHGFKADISHNTNWHTQHNHAKIFHCYDNVDLCPFN